MKVVRTIAEARDELAPLRAGSVGLVPTMGSLHEGHLALLDAARAENDTVVMSLFVNPAQFGDASDLARYPRDEERDLGLAARVWSGPRVRALDGRDVSVRVPDMGRRHRGSASILEGRFRPGHFRGVATVVLKLLNVVRPTRVYFGQKDAQQVEVIRRLIADLALEVELRASRPSAMRTGSRSLLATRCSRPTERAAALALPRALPGATVRQPSPPRVLERPRDRLPRESPTSTHRSSPAPCASARPASSTTSP